MLSERQFLKIYFILYFNYLYSFSIAMDTNNLTESIQLLFEHYIILLNII